MALDIRVEEPVNSRARVTRFRFAFGNAPENFLYLRLARILTFVCPSSSLMGCNMEKPEKTLPWWDRETDRAGRPIRADVRSAAQEIWTEACRRTEALLADRGQAAELMEESVAQVSRYLDRIEAPKSCAKNGLLLLAFSRALRRLAAKSRRLQFAGGAVDLSRLVVDSRWSCQMDARLELENIARNLSDTNGAVLALRHAGYSWHEVAQKFGTSVTSIRNSFWREVKDLRKRLRSNSERPCHGTSTGHLGDLTPLVCTSTNSHRLAQALKSTEPMQE